LPTCAMLTIWPRLRSIRPKRKPLLPLRWRARGPRRRVRAAKPIATAGITSGGELQYPPAR